MRCPKCDKDGLKASDTRVLEGSMWIVRRRRFCESCDKDFTTYEVLSEDYDFMKRQAAILSGLGELIEASRPANAQDRKTQGELVRSLDNSPQPKGKHRG